MTDRVFDNAVIGSGATIEEDVSLGFKVNEKCGPTIIGDNCFLRKGTVIYGDVKLGNYFQSQHYVVIRARVKFGDYCSILNHSTIEGIARVGNGVRIMSNVYIPSRTWIGDNVFIGPNVTFSNDKYPKSKVRPDKFYNTILKKGCSIGANAAILPGITIGENAIVGAGSVVTQSFGDDVKIAGNPAKIIKNK